MTQGRSLLTWLEEHCSDEERDAEYRSDQPTPMEWLSRS